MAASNNDWDNPSSIILGSDLTTRMASRIVGAPPPPLLLFSPLASSETVTGTDSALFSFHRMDASIPPAIRNPMDSSNGPVGPRAPAATVASCPARIATSESPAYA